MRNKTFILVTTLATVSGNVLADSIVVDNSNDSGYGSFRAAVEAANSDPNIDRIHFSDSFTIDLESEVVFSGAQDLVIEGGGSTLSGETVADDIDTWDSGLLVATGGADLTIEDLAFVHSFNNGLAVFLPEGSDDVSIELDNVFVSESQFFGVLVDGQATTGFNTDDILHYACTDPHPVDAGM